MILTTDYIKQVVVAFFKKKPVKKELQTMNFLPTKINFTPLCCYLR